MAGSTLTSALSLSDYTLHSSVVADVNGAAVDANGYEQVLLLVKLGTTSGTGAETIDIRMQESDSSTSGFADVSGAVSASVALTSGASTGRTIALLVQARTKRYVRYHLNVTGTTPSAGNVMCMVLLGSPKNSPANIGATEQVSV